MVVSGRGDSGVSTDFRITSRGIRGGDLNSGGERDVRWPSGLARVVGAADSGVLSAGGLLCGGRNVGRRNSGLGASVGVGSGSGCGSATNWRSGAGGGADCGAGCGNPRR